MIIFKFFLTAVNALLGYIALCSWYGAFIACQSRKKSWLISAAVWTTMIIIVNLGIIGIRKSTQKKSGPDNDLTTSGD